MKEGKRSGKKELLSIHSWLDTVFWICSKLLESLRSFGNEFFTHVSGKALADNAWQYYTLENP